MSLSDFASIGSLVSGVAVLVSLIFLYFQVRQVNVQVRQTERNQRSIINQGATARSIAANAWLTEPHISAMFNKSMSDPLTLTDAEVFQLSGVLRNAVLSFQDAWLQHQTGLADDITLRHAEASLRFFLAIPAVRAMYRMFGSTYAPDMRAVLDRILEDTPQAPAPRMAEQLRAILAQDGRASSAGERGGVP